MAPKAGRGGAGAGRPRPPAGKVRIGGLDIEYDEDTQGGLHDRAQPSQTFPPYKVADARPISARERTEIARYCSIRDRIHKGPLYTTFEAAGPAAKRGEKRKAPAAAAFDAFNGMQTYSMRYITKKRKIPRLDMRPYVLQFFPEELHGVLSSKAQANGVRGQTRRKQLQTDFDMEELEADDEVKVEDNDEDAANPKPVEDGDIPAEEDVDDDFDEDDDDDGNDYNAENYFDDGADDDVDEGMGGGDDGD